MKSTSTDVVYQNIQLLERLSIEEIKQPTKMDLQHRHPMFYLAKLSNMTTKLEKKRITLGAPESTHGKWIALSASTNLYLVLNF